MENFRLTTNKGTEYIYFPEKKRFYIYIDKSFIGLGNIDDWKRALSYKDITIENNVSLKDYQKPIFKHVEIRELYQQKIQFEDGKRIFVMELPITLKGDNNKTVNLAVRCGRRVYITNLTREVKANSINGTYFFCKYEKF